MTPSPTLPELALITLRDPRAASEVILGWNVPKEALWTAIALVSVIVTILSSLSNMLFPVPAPLGAIVGNPFTYFLVVAGGFIAMVHAIYWTGRMMGGRGAVEDLMVLLLWLQALRATAQVGVLILLVLAPIFASFLVLIVAAATLWIFVHFISVGLQLHSVLKALIVLFVGAAVLITGLSFFMSLIGVSAMGVPFNV